MSDAARMRKSIKDQTPSFGPAGVASRPSPAASSGHAAKPVSDSEKMRNPLTKDKIDRSWVPGDIGDYQLRDWRFCEHAVKGFPLKIRVRTNQKSELMAAWNEDMIHVTSEFGLPA
jgi:hypothetical protein